MLLYEVHIVSAGVRISVNVVLCSSLKLSCQCVCGLCLFSGFIGHVSLTLSSAPQMKVNKQERAYVNVTARGSDKGLGVIRAADLPGLGGVMSSTAGLPGPEPL